MPPPIDHRIIFLGHVSKTNFLRKFALSQDPKVLAKDYEQYNKVVDGRKLLLIDHYPENSHLSLTNSYYRICSAVIVFVSYSESKAIGRLSNLLQSIREVSKQIAILVVGDYRFYGSDEDYMQKFGTIQEAVFMYDAMYTTMLQSSQSDVQQLFRTVDSEYARMHKTESLQRRWDREERNERLKHEEDRSERTMRSQTTVAHVVETVKTQTDENECASCVCM